ncbi:CLUMA_CG016836, isoform A [Clunio marinus]|uniref:CLUMA_CG016836, isoform A n=1 Tax=Clunio marinus TaxID=568069 RepID=A0A1J1IUA7_9DIPT|nr:CLUMA_CG016836, isoform A [Clunio marinus]
MLRCVADVNLSSSVFFMECKKRKENLHDSADIKCQSQLKSTILRQINLFSSSLLQTSPIVGRLRSTQINVINDIKKNHGKVKNDGKRIELFIMVWAKNKRKKKTECKSRLSSSNPMCPEIRYQKC